MRRFQCRWRGKFTTEKESAAYRCVLLPSFDASVVYCWDQNGKKIFPRNQCSLSLSFLSSISLSVSPCFCPFSLQAQRTEARRWFSPDEQIRMESSSSTLYKQRLSWPFWYIPFYPLYLPSHFLPPPFLFRSVLLICHSPTRMLLRECEAEKKNVPRFFSPLFHEVFKWMIRFKLAENWRGRSSKMRKFRPKNKFFPSRRK